MKLLGKGPVLFIGSGPYRISQEIRGNIFAHSCLACLGDKGAPYVVMDNDAAGVFREETDARDIICKPFDAESIADVIDSTNPSMVWPVCAGKQVQGLVTGVLEAAGLGDLLPGGPGAYEAATDWRCLRETAERAGVDVPFGSVACSLEEAAKIAGEVGFPVFLSASRPRGGGGARIAYNHEELAAEMLKLLSWSLTGEVLVVRVYERHPHCQVHLLRDSAGAIEILGIVDVLGPLGVHISNAGIVFPGMGLPQELLREVTGCAGRLAEATGLVGYGVFHFGLDAGRAYAVGMSAGFGAASYIVSLGLSLDLGRAATTLALGGGLSDALERESAEKFTVVSAPKFDSALFPGAADVLGPHKTSTGRGVGLAEAFPKAFLAAWRSARSQQRSLFEDVFAMAQGPDVLPRLGACRGDFAADVIAALLQGHTIEQVSAATGISRFYLEHLAGLLRIYRDLKGSGEPAGSRAAEALEAGFSRGEIAQACGCPLEEAAVCPPGTVIRRGRGDGRAFVVCGAPARSIGGVDESDVILHGLCRAWLEKDYRLVFAGWSSQLPLDLFFSADEIHLGESGQVLDEILTASAEETIYVDPRNPDRLALSRKVASSGAVLAGPEASHLEALSDRKVLAEMLAGTDLIFKEGREVTTCKHALQVAGSYGYPVLVKPACPGMPDTVAYDEGQLEKAVLKCKGAAVVERFLEEVVECAVVVLCDGHNASAVAVTEVLEESGISSLDCAGVLPPFSIPERALAVAASRAEGFAVATGIKGLLTVRVGLRYDMTYFLSAVAGGTREVPFAALALDRDIVGATAAIFGGETLEEAWPRKPALPKTVFIRQPVFSFDRFPGADTVLGTQARSTGDVLGTGGNFALAFANARRAAGRPLPTGGTVFVSLRDCDKREGMLLGGELKKAGFNIVATEGTANALAGAGVDARVVHRVSEGQPNVVDLIKNREISMVIYTPAGRVPREDEVQIRTVAWGLGIPVITTIGEARAAIGAIEALGNQ